MAKSDLARFGEVFSIIGLVNFTLFFIVMMVIGGDAFYGHQEGGRYFLAGNGKLTEASRSVFIYSKIHAYSIFITHPLAILGACMSYKSGRAVPI